MTTGEWEKNELWLLQRVFSATQSGVMITDATMADDPIIYVNYAFERITGYASEEVIGRNPRFLQAGDDDQPALNDLRASRAAKNDNVKWSGILRNYKKDGTLFYNELSSAAIRDEEGRASHHIGVLTDVTERKEAAEALHRNEERFRSLVQNALDVITVIGADGRIKYESPSIERVLGYRQCDLIGTSLLDHVHPEDREYVRERFVEGLKIDGATGKKISCRFRCKDDSWRHLEALGTNRISGPSVGGIVVNSRDVTERKRAEEQLAFEANLLDQVQAAIIAVDFEGTVTHWYNHAESLYGYAREETLGRKAQDLLVGPAEAEVAKEIMARLRAGGSWEGEFVATRRDGSIFPAYANNSLIRDTQGRSIGFVGVSVDITERKRAEEALETVSRQNELILNSAGEGIYGLDSQGHITFVNPAASRMLGFEPDELVGRPMHETVHHSYPDGTYYPAEDCPIYAALRDGEVHRSSDEVFWRADGTAVPVEYTSTPIQENSDLLVGAVVAFRDVTERKVLEERLEYQALHDPLTGLPNRTLFVDRLRHTLSRAERSQECVAVLFMDLDNFKGVNDSLGHEVGDGLLIAEAERLKATLRPGDTAARLGGDEFVILLEGLVDKGEATRVAERIKEALREPFALDEAGREMFVATSIGLSFNGSGLKGKPEDLLRDADVAMYAAKRGGKDRHEAFEGAMDARALGRLEVLADLRRALERDEFVVRYQPKVDLRSGRIVCTEALVYWEHPERGLLSPSEFVPLAEETGLIVPLGRRVLKEACRQTREWQTLYRKEPSLTASANLSAREFEDKDLVRDIARILDETGLEAGRLILEITESVVMKDAPSTAEVMRELKALGVKLSIDDFGTGYSSLSYLRRFPVDYLKIDRSFVERLGQGLGEDSGDEVVVSGIIGLAHAMGLEVVAEGVETEGQLAKLKDLGCDMAQGYYFSRPLPSEEAAEFLTPG